MIIAEISCKGLKAFQNSQTCCNSLTLYLVPVELRLCLTVERFNSLPEDTHIIIYFIKSELQLNSNMKKQRQMRKSKQKPSFAIAAVGLMRENSLQQTPFTCVIM